MFDTARLTGIGDVVPLQQNTVTVPVTGPTSQATSIEARLDALTDALCRLHESQQRLYDRLDVECAGTPPGPRDTPLEDVHAVAGPSGNHAASQSGPSITSVPAVPQRQPMYLTAAPVMPVFHGSNKQPVRYLKELEAYIKKLQIPADRQLDVVFESLQKDALDWSSIYRSDWNTFADFKTDFLHCYWSEAEQNKVRHQISTQKWSRKNGRSMDSHFAHYVSLAHLLTHPIAPPTLISELMRHFPANVQSLWQLKENKTLSNAAEFLRNQENIMVPATSVPPPTAQTAPETPAAKRFRWDRGDKRNYNEGAGPSAGNGARSS